MSKSALVTGASGFLGGWITKLLLEEGWIVKGTVRDLKNKSKIDFLSRLSNSQNLSLVEANLMSEGSFDSAVQNVDVVFHSASPFFVSAKNPQAELIDPAVNGTRNVLNAVAKIQGKKPRIVLTSSVAAVISPPVTDANRVYTEEDWNETSTIDTTPYPLSKTLAEKEAWKLSKENGLDLVVINPPLITGEVLTDNKADALNTSSDFMKKAFIGENGKVIPSFAFSIVDVKDVARAHVIAATSPVAVGNRYICCSGFDAALNGVQICDILRRFYPENDKIPTEMPEKVGIPSKFDTSKIKRDFGMSFTPVDQSLKGTIDSLKEKKFI